MEAERNRVHTAFGIQLPNNLEVLRGDAEKFLELRTTIKPFLVIEGTVKPLDGKLGDLSTRVNVAYLSLLHAGASDYILMTDRTDVMCDFAAVAEQNFWRRFET